MNACSLFCKAVSPCTCKSLYSFRLMKLKNHQFWPYFKILSFFHLKNLQIWTNHTKITLLQFCQIWKNIKFYHNLKNLQFWSYFEKSSFFAKIWKIFKFEQILINLHFQFWLNFKKSSNFTKIWIIINF